MKILVCVKEVVEPESPVRINDDRTWTLISESTRFELNPFDAYALEEAIRIKESIPGTVIHAVTVGPERARNVLVRALGMGADEGIHILDTREGFRPPQLTAQWIAAAARRMTPDLILTGIMSQDEMNGQTGPMIAQYLDIPCCTAVIKETLSQDQTTARVEREIEGGIRQELDIRLPCVLAVQTGINTPRYPALSKVLRAKRKELIQIDAEALGHETPAPVLSGLSFPDRTPKGIVLEGSLEEMADHLFTLLEQKALL